jgi:hypothetical protein
MNEFPHSDLMRNAEPEIPAGNLSKNAHGNSGSDARFFVRYPCIRRMRSFEGAMPGTGHGWQFIGKEPVIFKIVVSLLLANGASSLALGFFVKHFVPQNLPNSRVCEAMSGYGIRYGVPDWICWYANWDLAITGILFGLVVLITIIYRKDVRHIR